MKLLDTHIFIWYVLDIQRLTAQVQALVDDENNEILLSTASIWEMAIKQSTGKLSFSLPFKMFIMQQLDLNKFNLLQELRSWNKSIKRVCQISSHCPSNNVSFGMEPTDTSC